jgi:hypothetical protein
MDAETIERFAPPAQGELENFVQFLEGQVVGDRNQPRHERANFQQNDSKGNTVERRKLRHTPKLTGCLGFLAVSP